ncbi:RING finger protein 146, partial [Caligus rogercresseyi]
MSTEVPESDSLECPVCLQSAVQPVKLPCKHIFCFLCVKGASAQNQACPLCRSPITHGYLDAPEVVVLGQESPSEESSDEAYAWFYEGREGWWRYDDRTSKEMEEIYASSQDSGSTAELLIAGFIYVIDFENEVQY